MTTQSTNHNNMNHYQNDLRVRRTGKREAASRQQLLDDHRAGVENSVALDRKATRLEEQIRRYDDPETGFARGVAHAKKKLLALALIGFTYFVITVADFALATPDVVEALANKSMSLFGSAEETAAALATPVWLRVSVGLVFTVSLLLITSLIKYCCDHKTDAEAIGKLEPGEDAKYRKLKWNISWKIGLKCIYMIALGVLFHSLYSYDAERARMLHQIQSLNSDAAGLEEMQFEFSDAGMIDAAGSSGAEEADDAPGSYETLSAPALFVYSILWILHGLLVLIPNVSLSEQRESAGFNRNRTERRIGRLRDEEGRQLRSLLHRIRDHEGELRDALVREALPVATRLNQAVGRRVIELPEGDDAFAVKETALLKNGSKKPEPVTVHRFPTS